MTLLEFNIRYILLPDIHTYSISVAQWLAWQSSTAKIGVRFPVVKNIYKLGTSDAVNFFFSTDDERDRRLNFTSLEFGVLAMFWLNPWSVKGSVVPFVLGVNQENWGGGRGRGVQDCQHQWQRASSQTFFQL